MVLGDKMSDWEQAFGFRWVQSPENFKMKLGEEKPLGRPMSGLQIDHLKAGCQLERCGCGLDPACLLTK